MSSEHLASAQNELKGNLGGAWNILDGAQGQYQDLGIARRFGGSSVAYSLRDIGAVNGRVVKVRRNSDDVEEDFSASRVQSGALGDWVNGKLESALPADVATAAAAYSLRKVKASYASNAVRIRRTSDDIEVNVAFDSDDKVSASSTITNIAEEGGDIGLTNATTLGAFLTEITPEGDGAFVHTWYDQAGSNDAVQATSANQPQLAASGVLLSDGLKFDGSNDFLQTSGQVLTNNYTGARSLYGVCKINTDSGYIFGDAGSGTDEGTSFYADTASDKIFFTNGKSGTVTAYDNITTTEGSNFLISSNYNNNNATTIHKNGSNSGYTQGTGSYDFGTSSRFTIANREGGSSAATLLNGSIKEIIAYDSDQTNNRFKIESNINNYYDLYNDENEFASDETAFRFLGQRSGGTSTSSDLTKFTLDVQTASGYAGAKLSADVVSGDVIYVSFNASLDEGSATASPKVGLRDIDSALNGSLYSNEGVITEGFNSFALTSTNSNASGIVWSEGDDNVIFTISDIRLSRIERNGFVSIWYDQSSNGDNATQTSESAQPGIVLNGSLVTNEAGKPTLDFVATADFMEVPTALDNINTASVFCVFDRDVNSGNGVVASQLGSSGTTSRMYTPFFSSSNMYWGYGDSATKINMGTYDADRTYLGSFVTGDTNAEAFLDNVSKGTTAVQSALVDGSPQGTIGRITRGSSSFPLNGKVSELIYYKATLQSDADTINTEINNHYNIY